MARWVDMIILRRLAMLALGLGSLTGCAASGNECVGSIDASQCRRDAASDGARDSAPSPTQLLSIEIMPRDVALVSIDGSRPTAQFTVVGRQRDGRTRPVTALRYAIDVPALGAIGSATGMFTSSAFGGMAHVHVDTTDGSGLWAETTLSVTVHRTVRGTGVTDADVARFTGAMTAPDEATTSPVVNYPLEHAVMPRNVHPPRIMWTPRHSDGAATDLYHVHLSRPHATLDGYFLNTPDLANAWQLGEDFAALSSSDVGELITLTVASLSASGLREGAAVRFRTIDGVVAGSVYYWSPPQGRLLRIDVDTAVRTDFLPHPPGETCIACHAVSRDGRHLVAIINHDTGSGRLAGYDLTADLTGAPPPTTFTSDVAALWVASFNPAGTRVVAAHHDGSPLSIFDCATGATMVTSPTNDSGGDPEWSPDGASIAYSDGGNLMTVSVDPANTLGAPAMLHAGAAAAGVDWHPTWTPDSQWLVFQGGDQIYTRGAAGLWMIPRAGGTAVRLNHLNGGPMVSDSFRPVFSPFNSGGYFWVLFTGTRTYGNAQSGVAPGSKQIWVAAIRNRPDGTMDPSEVPYYLDGQEAVTNLSPYWAPPPCRDNGNACSTGSQCCSGTCDPDSTGSSTCHPPSGACRARGASCGGGTDCCPGYVCTEAHICDLPLPG